MTALELGRAQVLAHRRRAGFLDERLPAGEGSREKAAHAGLQDSMPRAAVLSAHARVEGVGPLAWEDPPFVQVWGPRFNAYVVAEADLAVFTLGRLSDDPAAIAQAYAIADRFEAAFGGARTPLRAVGQALGGHHNQLRYAAPTGRVLLRWEGGGSPLVWSVPAPEVDPVEARLELARRYLHVLGPGTAAGFSNWAGIKLPRAAAVLDMLRTETIPTAGEGVILASDEESFTGPPDKPAPARLLPSGDSYWLLHGEGRNLLVPDERLRGELWTPRVWPGAVLVEGEIVGTWRRAGHRLTVQPWHQLGATAREAVEAEAAGLPLPDLAKAVEVTWE